MHKTNLIPLLKKLNYFSKAASDGYDSSMPDDPTGDGTTEPRTGAAYTQYAKDLDAIETVPPNADSAEQHTMDEDEEQENSLTSFTLTEAGSPEQSAKGEYEGYADDPGTSMPAEAGQEKYSSAMDCSLEQNIAIFNKCAESLMHSRDVYNNQMQQKIAAAQNYVNNISRYPVGYFTKLAAEEGASPEEVNEVAAIEALANEDPELLEALSEATPEELAELASVADAVEAGEAGVAEDVPAEPSPEEKMAYYMPLTKRAIDEGASPEEIEETAAIEQLAQEAPELVDAIMNASPEELDELQAALEAVESEGTAPAETEITPEEMVDLEKQSFFAQEPINQQLLASMSDADLQKVAGNIESAMKRAQDGTMTVEEANEILQSDPKKKKKKCAGGNCSDSGCKTAEAMSVGDFYNAISSYDLYQLALQKKAEEEAAAFESLTPEEQEALATASDEDLQSMIDEGEAAQESPEALEELLAEGDESSDGEDISEEEALNELASAMEDEGVTPEALEAASKQASADPTQRRNAENIARKVSTYIKSGKHTYGPCKTQKAARARYISHQYLKEILHKN